VILLITGGAGFIGSHLARRALADGWRVRIVDALVPQVHGDSAQLPDWMSSECEFLGGDVRDADLMQRAVDGVDAVAHLAADTGTGQSMYAVQKYVDVNVGGTAVLLEALQRATACRRLVVASSRAVYGEGQYSCKHCGVVHPPLRDPARLARGEWEPVCPECGGPVESMATGERALTRPVSVYGTTKLAQELLAENHGTAFGLPVLLLRFQNVYGPGQSLVNPYTGILTHFFNAIRRGSAPRVFEDGLESRDFVHVDDVVSAVMAALRADGDGGHTLNVGSGIRTSIQQLALDMCRVMRSAVEPAVVGEFRIGDIRHSVADLTTARRVLGYAPRIELATGLAQFVEWASAQQQSSSSEATANSELASLGLLRSANAD
jgi:dTDP-L-rhamnose 4-epimerase